jgi:hypothetical protein
METSMKNVPYIWRKNYGNENVPYIWRKNYRNEIAFPERVLETAHEKARYYLNRGVGTTRSMT